MKRQELVCDYCDSESTIETLFCPLCGSEIPHEEEMIGDWDENDEAWD